MKPSIKSTTLILIILISVSANAYQHPDIKTFIKEKHKDLQQLIKAEKNIKAMCIALFSTDRIIWKECFGKSTTNRPVDDFTLFSIQSMSKNFTALAVLNAVQDGLVDLDIPITQYLPGFTVNSCYERSPEDKITLRMMLNHTAGFTHEAPCGNNYDYRCPSKRDHWDSIRKTWLKFPAGTRFSYSNLGYDLAAEIIENVSGMSFETYMKTNVFQPLKMKYSTVDDREFVSNKNTTEGYISPYVKKMHYAIPLIGSGAVYSNINEMISYVQFHLKFGKINTKQLIKKELLYEMYSIHKNNYGMGTVIGQIMNDKASVDTYFLNHNGGGFGYGSSMTWFPEYGLGCVILGYGYSDYERITKDLILLDFIERFPVRKSKNLTQGFVPSFGSHENTEKNPEFVCRERQKSRGGIYKQNITGKYEVIFRGMELKWWAKLLSPFLPNPTKIKITMEGESLVMKGYFGEHKLKEFLPNLHFTPDGEAFDYRNEVPTFRNVRLKKNGKRRGYE